MALSDNQKQKNQEQLVRIERRRGAATRVSALKRFWQKQEGREKWAREGWKQVVN
jgi:hypothetical protein